MNTKHFTKIILSLMACCMLLNACALQTRKVLYSYNDSNGTTPVKKYEVVQERRYEKHIKSFPVTRSLLELPPDDILVGTILIIPAMAYLFIGLPIDLIATALHPFVRRVTISQTTETIEVAGKVQYENNRPASGIKVFDKYIGVSSDGTFNQTFTHKWRWERKKWEESESKKYTFYSDPIFVREDGEIMEYPGKPFVNFSIGGDDYIRYEYPFGNSNVSSKGLKGEKNIITISK